MTTVWSAQGTTVADACANNGSSFQRFIDVINSPILEATLSLFTEVQFLGVFDRFKLVLKGI